MEKILLSLLQGLSSPKKGILEMELRATVVRAGCMKIHGSGSSCNLSISSPPPDTSVGLCGLGC